MRLIVERGQGVDPGRVPELVHEMIYQFKKQLLVTPEVELVDYGHLPRSERKNQRIFDNRLNDDVV
jgi:phenylacetate-coenzyme A ligase PaaK-like adenylate-forming protein